MPSAATPPNLQAPATLVRFTSFNPAQFIVVVPSLRHPNRLRFDRPVDLRFLVPHVAQHPARVRLTAAPASTPAGLAEKRTSGRGLAVLPLTRMVYLRDLPQFQVCRLALAGGPPYAPVEILNLVGEHGAVPLAGESHLEGTTFDPHDQRAADRQARLAIVLRGTEAHRRR
jgi:hypothetical protein